MENLFESFRSKIPNFNADYKVDVFEKLSLYGGGTDERRDSRGKYFETGYELYIYAFFLGLYRNEFVTIPEKAKKENFRVPIKDWGNKSGKILRKDFSQMQEYIFSALIAKTEIDFIALEKGEIEEDVVIKNIIHQFECFTNGGLIYLKNKYEEHPAYFMRASYLLDLIKESI